GLLVDPATEVAGAVALVPERAAGDGAGAGPAEHRDLPVAGGQHVTQGRAARVDDVEADLVTAGLDEVDLVGAPLVARAVADADLHTLLEAGLLELSLRLLEVDLVEAAVVGRVDLLLVVLLEGEQLAAVHDLSLGV